MKINTGGEPMMPKDGGLFEGLLIGLPISVLMWYGVYKLVAAILSYYGVR
jgi:hypothetical protein